MYMKIFILFVFSTTNVYCKNRNLIRIDEENWRQILQGEWMMEFHAPWCPACRDLQKAWDSFADWSQDLQINVAEIDVTTSPGLSGRFLVTALPTIYHVKDGVFRLYSGPRDKEDFINFVQDKKWSSFKPISNWKHPDTVQMTVVSYFFKVSMSVRDLHNYFVEQQGIPPWGSYAIFGITTLVLGCVLGFLIVCLIDCLFPTSFSPSATAVEQQTEKASSKKHKQDQKNKDKKKENKNISEQQRKSKDNKKSDVEKSDAEKSAQNTQSSQSEGELSNVEEEKKDVKENIRQRKKIVANGKAESGKK